MDDHRDEPDDFSEAQSLLVIEASKDHEAHGEACIKACRNGLAVFISADAGIHDELHDVKDHDHSGRRHGEIPDPGESQPAVHISKGQSPYEGRQHCHRHIFDSLKHTCGSFLFLLLCDNAVRSALSVITRNAPLLRSSRVPPDIRNSLVLLRKTAPSSCPGRSQELTSASK